MYKSHILHLIRNCLLVIHSGPLLMSQVPQSAAFPQPICWSIQLVYKRKFTSKQNEAIKVTQTAICYCGPYLPSQWALPELHYAINVWGSLQSFSGIRSVGRGMGSKMTQTAFALDTIFKLFKIHALDVERKGKIMRGKHRRRSKYHPAQAGLMCEQNKSAKSLTLRKCWECISLGQNLSFLTFCLFFFFLSCLRQGLTMLSRPS